ncbi:site-2 protease family protein [Listeria sp. PSOL-1]|uniref:site-2 protease family protein n=1 Tax=Listeria sp. PSOL-1 TaxID=1844999 RepID=UPI0013D87C98|nr:site-2 protease family protein [Listeria sp. PSOL-1]
MPQFFAYPLEELPYLIISLLIAFSFHEWAHALTALAFGDDTAKNEGRLSLNPFVHVDIIGLLMVVIAGFGWARPTPVNRFKLKHRRLGSVFISLAGPISNLLLAFIAVGVLVFITNGTDTTSGDALISFLYIFIRLNIVLFIFNLIPLPPLDGYQVVSEFFTQRMKSRIQPLEQYAFLIFLILALTPLYDITIGPIFNILVPSLLTGMVDIFQMILF